MHVYLHFLRRIFFASKQTSDFEVLCQGNWRQFLMISRHLKQVN